MKCAVRQCTILLTCVLLASSEAGAAGRAPDHAGTRAATSRGESNDSLQDLEAWLARLQGSFTVRFRIEDKMGNCHSIGNGLQECSRSKAVTYVSAANCRGGDGAGLNCTFDELRREGTSNDSGSVASTFFMFNGLPRRLQFGIDPVAHKISVIMDSRDSASGSLSGSDVTLKGKCGTPETASRPCAWSLSIHAPQDGGKIRMTRASQTFTGTDSNVISSLEEPHTFELTRVE